VEITGSRVNEKIQAGNYFGYGPPMIGLFHSSYCRTTRDCTMYVIDADTFSQLVRQFEGVKHRLIVDSVKQIRSLRGQEEIEEAEQRKRARNAEKGIFCKDFIDTPASTK
jgi:CRP-like cAMP-binding protein